MWTTTGKLNVKHEQFPREKKLGVCFLGRIPEIFYQTTHILHLYTPWKINIEPENDGLVQMISLYK